MTTWSHPEKSSLDLNMILLGQLADNRMDKGV
jgi:hypothetical protein